MATANNIQEEFYMNRFFREEEGQGLVEYALIIGLIAIVAIAALSTAGGSVKGLFTNINDKLGQANSGEGLGAGAGN